MREHNNIIGIATCNRFRVFYFTRLSCYIWSLRSGLVCVGVPWRVLLRLFLPTTGCAFELCLQVGGPPHDMDWSGVLEHRSSTLVSTASHPMLHGMYSLACASSSRSIVVPVLDVANRSGGERFLVDVGRNRFASGPCSGINI